jgi:hypothetical protein
MRSVVALWLFITLCAAANAATVHGTQPHDGRLRRHQLITVRPSQRVTAPTRFAVPGWTDEATQRWLDNATSSVGLGG